MEIDIEDGNNKPAESFRGVVEGLLNNLHGRLSLLEGGTAGSEAASNAAGLLRTFEARITQVETIQAENTSNILRLADNFRKELDTLSNVIADLQAQVKALQPVPTT